jgi:hypothetical protein
MLVLLIAGNRQVSVSEEIGKEAKPHDYDQVMIYRKYYGPWKGRITFGFAHRDVDPTQILVANSRAEVRIFVLQDPYLRVEVVVDQITVLKGKMRHVGNAIAFCE